VLTSAMPRDYIDISSNDELNKLTNSLADRDVHKIAMDFEGEFNLHVYGERLCLIQVFDGTDYYLVDPFKINDENIVRFLTIKNMLYIFFAADSDRSLVFKQYKVKMNAVYDLQHLVEVLDLPGKGLDSVLLAELGVTVENKKRFQRQNWITRPIEEGAKQYAINDVAYLFDLHKSLLDKIKKEGKVEDLVFKLAGTFKDFDKKSIPGIFKIPAYKRMSREKKNLYGQIVDLREACAKELNVPANTVLTKQDLVALTEDIQQIRRVRFHQKVPRSMQEQLIEDVSKLK
jgi:ribonuclease D